MKRSEIPDFFVYGEPSRSLDVGFLHIETVRDRNNIHLGRVALHKHPQMGQLTFWTSGSGTYQIEDKVWNFSAPAVSFVPSNIVHGFVIEPEADAIVVSIADDTLQHLAAHTLLPLDLPAFIAGRPGEVSWLRLAAALNAVAEEYREGTPVTEKILSGLIAVALSYLARLNAEQPQPVASKAHALASALRRMIDAHYRDSWTVERYVEALATTPHLLDKASRQVFNLPVKGVILERRLLEAKRLLLFTIRSVEDIAFEVGFQDAAYFSRFFRGRCSVAPSLWRKRQLEAASRRSGPGN